MPCTVDVEVKEVEELELDVAEVEGVAWSVTKVMDFSPCPTAFWKLSQGMTKWPDGD